MKQKRASLMEIPVKLGDPEKIMALNREALSEWNGV